jgi:two-component system NtrC family sensor kinase
MMKNCWKIFLFLFLPLFTKAQEDRADSLRKIFLNAGNDSVIYNASNQLYDYFEELNRDSAFFYAQQSVLRSEKGQRKLNEAYSLTRRGYQEVNMGRFAEALHSLLTAFSIAEHSENDNSYWSVEPLKSESKKRLFVLSCTHHIFGILMRETKNREQQIFHFREAKKIAVAINSPGRSLLGSLNLGRLAMEDGQLDSALRFESEGEDIARSSGKEKYLSTIKLFKGMILLKMKDTLSALQQLYECIHSGIAQHNMDGMIRGYMELAKFHALKGNKDSALFYSYRQLDISKRLGAVSALGYHIGYAYDNLFTVYHLLNQQDSAYKYLSLAKATNDSINQLRINSLAEFQQLTLNEQQRVQHLENEKEVYQNKVWTIFLIAGLGVLLTLTIIFYRNNQQKNKAKLKIEQAYENLKLTQQQLVQSEKMASLGELTAGIAHEIQNPLNFVNNFSEVSADLVEELHSELEAGNDKDAKEIAADLKKNLEKITEHGKRASSIVKGMLQHSRTSTGAMEPTDVNELADEYLRLSYHGLRAKDKSFNASYTTAFDKSISQVSLVPQDMGRVLLNLLNNAFYSVNEKKKRLNGTFEPAVLVSTRRQTGSVGMIEISIKDNGGGIPDKVRDKIYQPFFTTKPTGEGTGWGYP